MTEVPKAERILRLIRILRNSRKTVPQLAALLDAHPRSIYRDLEALQNVGYLLRKDDKNRYSLEENPTAANGEGRQVQLVKYHSNNSATVEDRVVEPISLTEDYAILNAYEIASQKQKTFKLTRMEDVVLLASASTPRSESEELDFFGFSGPKPLPIVIRLSFLAHRLLHEEYPAARAYLALKHPGTQFPWEFRYLVRDFRGLSRFILGLPGEVQVVESEELREFLRGRVERGYG